MMNGKPYQCNPAVTGPRKGPCCSGAGYCGDTEDHCGCDTCVEYIKEGEASVESDDAATGSDEPTDEAGPDLEKECQAAAKAGEELHSEYCSLDCKHTMCKYPVNREMCIVYIK